jgi:hypothetical protein
LGNTQWNKKITVKSIIKTSNGKYVLVGSHLAQLVKIDEQGNTLWHNSNDGNYETDSGAVARDGGYIFCSTLAGSPIMATEYWGYVVKADPDGKMEWEIEYSKNSLINSIVASSDGGFVFTGVNQYVLSGGNDGLWFVKIDPAEIPEFPSLTPLLITSVAVVAVAVVYRQKLNKKNQR